MKRLGITVENLDHIAIYETERFNQRAVHPVQEVLVQEEMITVDTFSTYTNGRPIGNEEFCWVDTVEKTWGYFN